VTEPPLRLPGRPLPVLGDADAVVLGGTLASVAAAVALAGAGHRAVLVEDGYRLGTDLVGANRPWLTVPTAGERMPELLCGLLPEGAAPGTRVPLRPAAVVLHLEDAALAAGVRLLYGTRALALHRRGGTLRGVVVASKSGRQLVRASLVIDATGGEPAVRGTPRRTGGRRMWSVEFDKVAASAAEAARHPRADGVPLLDGCRGAGHLYGLFTLDGGREAAVEAAGALLRGHPAFSRAVLGAVGDRPLAAAGPAGAPTGPAPGVWTLAPPAPARRPGEALFDPCAAARAGERLARAATAAPAPGPPVAEQPPPVRAETRGPHVAEGDGPRAWRRPARERVADLEVPRLDHVDVLVVGGGTSGASAAVAAGRDGARTLLVEAGVGPGGTGTHGGVHSYWFGRRAGHAAALQDATRRTHRALGLRGGVGRWNIEAKSLTLHRQLCDAGTAVVHGARAFAALREGDRVTGVVCTGPEGPFAVTAHVVVDATGDADLAAWCGAPCSYGAPGLHTVMWASLARFDTPEATRNTFGGLADSTDAVDTTRAVLAARRWAADAHTHGAQPAARESRHLAGEAVVTLTDQLTARRMPDVVGVHFSNHDLKGKGEALWPQLGLIPPNLECQVPYRALLPRGLRGLLVTGKALSTTHDGLPALRMQADLENLGEVTGIAAARCTAEGLLPHELDVAALQETLVRRGRLPADAVAARPAEPPADPGKLIAALADRLPLHRYSDMGRRAVHRGGIPFVHLALDDRPKTTTALLDALRTAREDDGELRLVLAQLLALRGRAEGVDVLVTHLTARLGGDALPPRTSRIREAQLPPDQSAMPDEAYLLHTLAVARTPRAVPLWDRVALLLDAREEAFADPARAPFSWIDAVCAGAERLGDPAAVPALTALHARPALHGQHRTGGIEPDDLQERRALCELALARALAACGDAAGHRALVAYLDDNRALLAAQAHSRLTALTGTDLGADTTAWRAHLAAHPPTPRPLPPQEDPHAADLPPHLLRHEGRRTA
jgi:ribulose 1,5-bisphosphate synthetase/thiazole synthase